MGRIANVVRRVFGGGDEGIQFPENIVLSETSAAAQQPGNPLEDIAEMTRKIGYLTIDETVLNLLYQNPALQHWLLYVSPLNSTTKLSKQQAQLQAIRVELAALRSKLTMKPEVYENGGYEVIEGLRNYAHMRIYDAIEGWKGHLATENVKHIEARVAKK